MRKYLFLISLSIYIQSCFVAYANTTVGWVGTSIPAIATECPTEAVGARTKHGIPSANVSPAPTSGSQTCITHYYYASSDHPVAVTYNNGWITACPAGERVVWYNGSNQITCRKYDDTPPTVSDITYVCPVNELALNPKTFAVTVNPTWQAPMTAIDVDFEQANNPSVYDLVTSSVASSTLTFTRDISKVDGSDRDTIVPGGRQYWFRIIRVKDEAGNELSGSFASPLKNCDFNVYSNTQNIATKQVGAHNLASAQVANGQVQSMPINLADTYGNAIIPASWIGRTIDFNFNVTNSLYLNQYTRTWPFAVFVEPPSGGSTNSIPANFNAQPSANGQYVFGFKTYTPTYQNYKADPNGKFIINGIDFDVNGSLGPISAQAVAGSNIDFNFKPLYQTTLSGDLRNGGFIEGARQDSFLSVTRNGSVNGSGPVVQLEFGGADSGKFNLYGGTTTGLIDTHQISTRSDIVSPAGFPTSASNLFTKLVQDPLTIWNTSNTYLSTHISYTLDGLPVLYNSDIVGRGNYFGTNTDLTQQGGLKVLGLASSKKSQALTTNQFINDVNLLGTPDKFFNKTQLIKNATLFVRNITPSNGSNIVSNLSGNNSAWVERSNVLYFWGLNGANVELGNGSDIAISGKRTLLVIWGNVYIRSNIYYNSLANDMLGIIVLKDNLGNGGNIYIDPSVTNIAGSLFTEKSVISYDGTKELDGNTPVNTLKNQLYIYGNVFSENTIGGSRKSTPQCPFYVSGTCDTVTAQKYDLNFLRRYYLVNNSYPYGNGKVIGWGTCNSTSSCSGHDAYLMQTRTFTVTSNKYASSPVIIEYNPNTQKNPPPLFSIKP